MFSTVLPVRNGNFNFSENTTFFLHNCHFWWSHSKCWILENMFIYSHPGIFGPKTRWSPLFKPKIKIIRQKSRLFFSFGDFAEGYSRSLVIFSLPHTLRSFWNKHDINRVHNGSDMCKNIAKKWMFSKYVTLFWHLIYF